MKKIVLFIFMSVFVYGKSILILSTYSEGYLWTNTLLNYIYSNYSLDYEVDFLEFEKKLGSYQEKYNAFDKSFKKLTSEKKYEFVIVLDEDAYFYIENQSEEFHRNNFVVASGILPNIDQNKTDYVIYEEIDMEKTIKLALKINPKLKGIVLLNLSHSPKVNYLNSIFKSLETKYRSISFEVFQDRDKESLKRLLAEIPEDYFFIQGYYPDSTSSDLKEVDYWNILNTNIKTPMLSYWSTEIRFPFSLGGYVTSANELGKGLVEAIDKHLKGILFGKSMKVEGHYLFNGENLESYGYSIRKLPKTSVLFNDEYLNVDLYKKLFYTLIILLTVISSTLIILFINFKKNKKLYKKL